MKCEYCKKEHDGSYGSGRFCSNVCARGFSTSKNRNEINNKVSEKLKGKPVPPKTKEQIERWRNTFRANHWNKIKDSNVVMYNGDILNITNEELMDYREEHTVCEICGKPETGNTFTGKNMDRKPNKLTVDHDHANNKFRGLLCKNCNSRLGWLEANYDIIMKYLDRTK